MEKILDSFFKGAIVVLGLSLLIIAYYATSLHVYIASLLGIVGATITLFYDVLYSKIKEMIKPNS